MRILGCPMCDWKAAIEGGVIAEAFVRRLHIDAHCAEFREELGISL